MPDGVTRLVFVDVDGFACLSDTGPADYEIALVDGFACATDGAATPGMRATLIGGFGIITG